ncbi:MAG: sensor histidine kinase [Hyphomicrobium sp.]
MDAAPQLAECNHRVANSFHMAAAMLAIERSRMPIATEPLARVGAQLTAFALVHRMLTPSDSIVPSVLAADYFEALCRHRDHACLEPRGIKIATAFDRISLDPDRAQCLGLIVAELVLNAAKHAFQGSATGNVEVRFSSSLSGQILWVADDGVGYSEVEFDQTRGLGLVDRLARSQGGRLATTARSRGTRFSVRLEPIEGTA